MLKIIGFLLVGRLTIFLLQKFPFSKVKFIGRYFEEGKFLKELFECDLCLGVWCYAALGYIFRIDFVSSMFGTYLMGFNEMMTGAIASFVVHIFAIGWNTKFGVLMVE